MKAKIFFHHDKLLIKAALVVMLLVLLTKVKAQDYIKPTFPVFDNIEVNTFNGNMVYSRQDFQVNGNMPLILSFTYNSVNDTVDNGYGAGWYFNYGLNYSFDTLNNIIIIRNGGRRDLFTNTGTEYLAPVGIYDQLSEYEPRRFVLKTKEEVRYYFADSTHRKLTSIEDQAGNAISITYESGLPVSISNSSGRSANLTWTNYHLTEMSYNNASYSYNYTDGYLMDVTNPKGATESYQYSTIGKLVLIENYNSYPVYIEYNNGIVVNKIKSCSSEKSFSFVENKSFIIENGSSGKQTTCYSYDDHQRVIQITTPNQKSVYYEYDNFNNIKKFIDFEGNSTSFEYDSKGNLLSSTNAEGVTALATYDPSNKILSSTDQNGNSTGFTYDDYGNLLTITQPLNITSSFLYDETGNVTQATDPLGHSTGFTWDQNKNLVQLATPIGSTSMVYDISGNLTQITDANINILSFEYDACNSCGQVSKIKINDTISILFEYDANGNLIEETDPNGNLKTYGYDGLNRLVAVTIPAGTTSYQYDEQNNLTTVIDANGHNTQYAYTSTNQVASETDPIGNISAYVYDANGMLISETDANGNTIQYSYNSLNQLIMKSYPGNTDHFSYDAVGNLAAMYNNNINISYTYDALNRLTRKTINNWNKTIAYTYDKAGNRSSMTDPDGGVTNYVYDANNRLTSLTNPFGETTTFEYDLGGRLLKQTNANGTFSEYVYNPHNLLISLFNKKSSGEILSSYQYTYDKAGNRLSMTVNGTDVHQYTYDASNRLTDVVYPSGETESFTYDGSGNRISHQENNTTFNYTYNPADHLISDGNASYTFDNNGNMTGKTENGLTTMYEYNALNRLLKIHYPDGTENSFAYDPFGNRISTTNKAGQVTRYLLDGDNVLMELNNTGNPTARYTTALNIDSWISMRRGNQVYVYHKDGLNSTTALSDASENVPATYTYAAFGEIKNKTGEIKNPITYTGREYDSESGNYYYRSRYYDSRKGRFCSKDFFKGFITNSSTLNSYVYVNNNPINKIDPNGFLVKESITIGSGLISVGVIGVGVIGSSSAIVITAAVVGLTYAVFGIEAGLLNLYYENIEHTDYRVPTSPLEALSELGELNGWIDNPNIKRVAKSLDLSINLISGIFSGNSVNSLAGFLSPAGMSIIKHISMEANSLINLIKLAKEINTISEIYEDLKNQFNKYFRIPVVGGYDPNEIIGPSGYDTLQWVAGNQNLAYSVLFENDPDFATAPAQNVLVKVPVTNKMNMSDFRLSGFGFGSFVFEVPQNSAFYTKRLDLRDSLGLYVDITAGLNVNTLEAFWLFESIDPATGLPPADPQIGFLPVNDSTISPGPGDGFISFTIKPKLTVKTGDSLLANASIIFDSNAPILTNTWVNRVDVSPPVSVVDSIIPPIGVNSFNISFSATDDNGGCGVSSIQLYYSKDDEPYVLHGEFQPDTTLLFTGSAGSSYSFFSRAIDHVGNTEPLKTSSDVEVSLESNNITGVFTYNNLADTPLDSLELKLYKNNHLIETISSDISGNFSFTGKSNGEYVMHATTSKPWSGVNGTDALKIQQHFAGIELITEPVRLQAADVNNSNSINGTDAIKVKRRFVGMDTTFPRGNWTFAKQFVGGDTVLIEGASVIQNFYGLCVGDVNGSYTPLPGMIFNDSKINFEHNGVIEVCPSCEFNLPIRTDEAYAINAISLVIPYPADLFEVLDVRMQNGEPVFKADNGEIRIAWSEVQPLDLLLGDTLLVIRMKATEQFYGDLAIDLTATPESELANKRGTVMPLAKLFIPMIMPLDVTSVSEQNSILSKCILYPNPATDEFNIEVMVSEKAKLNVEVIDMLGKVKIRKQLGELRTGTNSFKINSALLSGGIYAVKLELDNEKEKSTYLFKILIR